ncbi:hypothetical protein Egran_00071 [Elaphomyces granulatus]|uniref:Uncharacterized protein n=1 Tax=Elaphomyces granulatus TaxID=519963 RepID=A0A232M757_9EURO|nr:hypothetical protein Egran_00071 [Elaphomyces granulatus]
MTLPDGRKKKRHHDDGIQDGRVVKARDLS